MSAFPQVGPYGTGPRARFPDGLPRFVGSMDAEAAERERLLADLARVGGALASYAKRHPECERASELIDQAADALEYPA